MLSTASSQTISRIITSISSQLSITINAAFATYTPSGAGTLTIGHGLVPITTPGLTDPLGPTLMLKEGKSHQEIQLMHPNLALVPWKVPLQAKIVHLYWLSYAKQTTSTLLDQSTVQSQRPLQDVVDSNSNGQNHKDTDSPNQKT